MRRFLAWALGIAGTILVFVGAIFQQVIADLIKHHLQEITDWALKFLHAALKLSEQTWFLVTASFLVGFVAGFLTKWLLQRLDGSRAKERKELGDEMAYLGNYLGQIKFPFDTTYIARIMSCFASAKKFGIWAPDGQTFPFQAARARRLITDYLSKVGQMLSDGNFREAKRYAKKSKGDFDSIA